MARITLTDWTCSINGCVNPLDGNGILKNFTCRSQYNTIPNSWIIAQKLMGTMKPPLCLCVTNQSFLMKGEVLISHLLKIVKTHDNSSYGIAAYSLQQAGIKLVKQIGAWKSNNQSVNFQPFKIATRTYGNIKITTTIKKNWDKITHALSLSNFNWFFHSSTDLLIPRIQHHNNAECYITTLSTTCNFKPSALNHNNFTWATCHTPFRSMTCTSGRELLRTGY